MNLVPREYFFEILWARISWVDGAHWRLAHLPNIVSGTPGAHRNALLPMLVAGKVRV